MTLQVITLITESSLKGRKVIYLYLHVNTLVDCRKEYCHFFLTIEMGEKRAIVSLKETCCKLIVMSVNPVWLSSVNVMNIFKLLRMKVRLVRGIWQNLC